MVGWNSRLAWSGYLLGIALGGLFDGILLHQVLQWHHLLSLVQGEALRSITTQIFADGLFHVLMYVVALSGLWLLWRSRGVFAQSVAGRRLAVATLLGFALWNCVDVIGFHWVARIHRIRVDVAPDQRLAWDLGWLVLFGAVPFLIALVLERRQTGQIPPYALGILVVAAIGISARTPPGPNGRIVLFGPHLSTAEIFQVIADVDGEVIWIADENRLVAISLPVGSNAWHLYRRGALMVSGPGSPSGCLTWLETSDHRGTAAKSGMSPA